MLIFQGVGLITPVITPTFGWSVWDAWAPHIFSLQSCATDAVRNLLIRSVSMNWYGLQIRNSKTLVLVRWKKDNLIVYINMCIYKTIYIFLGRCINMKAQSSSSSSSSSSTSPSSSSKKFTHLSAAHLVPYPFTPCSFLHSANLLVSKARGCIQQAVAAAQGMFNCLSRCEMEITQPGRSCSWMKLWEFNNLQKPELREISKPIK